MSYCVIDFWIGGAPVRAWVLYEDGYDESRGVYMEPWA